MQTQIQIQVWTFIRQCLKNSTPVMLLYVVESQGSSPGRCGFFMAASENECIGTVGGGIMEYKLVELCRDMIKQQDMQTRLITQYHDKIHTTNQSGMICSGMQRITLIPMRSNHLNLANDWIATLEQGKTGHLVISPQNQSFTRITEGPDEFVFKTETSWQYQTPINTKPKLHIIGAGHVSLALSDLMAKLGFYVIVYDNRSQLNTLNNNHSASEKHLIEYESIGSCIKGDPKDYVVIMTIGYRTDKTVLTQMIGKSWYYIGMLGSKAKIKRLYEELTEEGWSFEKLSRVSAPIGIPIQSQTADEIAVSIAAELIRERRSRT